MPVFSKNRPGIVFDYHCLSSIMGLPALVTAEGENDSEFADKCRRIVQIYGEGLFLGRDGLKSDEEAIARWSSAEWLRFSPAGRTMSSWFYHLGRIPAFTLEGLLMKAHQTVWMDRTDLALLEEYQIRHARAIENTLRGWFW